MKDYGYHIRQGYFNAINGLVTYDSGIIPVVDEKLDNQLTEHDIYIKLSTQNDQQVNTKCYFAATCEVLINIVQRTKSVGGKMVVDDISDQVLTLLFPTPQTTTITVAAPMQLAYARFENSNTSPLQQIDSGFIQVKTLTFSNRVTQAQ